MSGGFTPSVHLFSQSRGTLAWDDTLQTFLPAVAAERARSAGACRGVYELTGVLLDGAAAGAGAAHEATALGREGVCPAAVLGPAAAGTRPAGGSSNNTSAGGFAG